MRWHFISAFLSVFHLISSAFFLYLLRYHSLALYLSLLHLSPTIFLFLALSPSLLHLSLYLSPTFYLYFIGVITPKDLEVSHITLGVLTSLFLPGSEGKCILWFHVSCQFTFIYYNACVSFTFVLLSYYLSALFTSIF